MNKPCLYVVCDDSASAHVFKEFGEARGARVEVYTHAQWEHKMGGRPHLVEGHQHAIPSGSNVLHFPTPVSSSRSANVESITDVEAKAIETAINAFGGNLTEAAKALGIGRATLYRKVKQYNIDPSLARRKKVA
jgi:DNA-binding NtrC family response regulator